MTSRSRPTSPRPAHAPSEPVAARTAHRARAGGTRGDSSRGTPRGRGAQTTLALSALQPAPPRARRYVPGRRAVSSSTCSAGPTVASSRRRRPVTSVAGGVDRERRRRIPSSRRSLTRSSVAGRPRASGRAGHPGPIQDSADAAPAGSATASEVSSATTAHRARRHDVLAFDMCVPVCDETCPREGPPPGWRDGGRHATPDALPPTSSPGGQLRRYFPQLQGGRRPTRPEMTAARSRSSLHCSRPGRCEPRGLQTRTRGIPGAVTRLAEGH